MLSTYFQDYYTFYSFTALREKALYNKILLNNTPKHQIATRTRQKTQPKVYDFQNDDNVIIAIFNDDRFMNVIMNSKNQKVLLAYIFVEYEYGYITCILKNPDGFPLMIIKMPIDKKFAFAKNVNSCYEFPIGNIVGKDIKFNKNCMYLMMWRHNGQQVQFVYDIYPNNAEPTRITINDIKGDNNTIIDNLLTVYDINLASQNIPYNTGDDVGNYTLFNRMSIKMLACIHPGNIFQFNSGKSNDKAKHYFQFEDNKFYYVYKIHNQTNKVPICSESAPNVIYWDSNNLNNLKLDMYNFENLFKNGYTKSIKTNDRVYYVLTMFMNNYIFMKLFTPLEVDENAPIDTFINLFSHDYQIMECYMCHA